MLLDSRWGNPRQQLQSSPSLVPLLLMATSIILPLSSTTFVHAIAPPSANFTDWEPLPARRRRLGLDASSYQPQHISPEHCRYLSDDDCQFDDEEVRHAKEERRLTNLGSNIRVLVLLCRFTDHEDRALPDPSYYEELFNGQGTSETNPVGSVREWLLSNSLNRYDATFDIQPWKTTANTEAYYAGGQSGLRGANAMQEMIYPLMDNLDSGGMDWSVYDSDNWGNLDHLVVVHSGYAAEHGNPSDGCTNQASDRIWSQGIASTTYGWISSDSSYSVSTFLLTSAFAEGLCNAAPTMMGIVTHEYMHGFGLIDLYDQDREEDPIPLGGTGKFGIMSNLYGWKRNQKKPGHLNPHSRVAAEWLDPIEITEDGLYPIQPSEISSQIYSISTNFPSGELLYIENRQPLKWDGDWDASGIVIYKIDNNIKSQFSRGYPGKSDWPTAHYQVTVLQADGEYGIEKGISPGDTGDFWTKGMKLSSGGDWPNTDAYSNGNRVQTGVEIEIMSDSSYTMLFKVSGLS